MTGDLTIDGKVFTDMHNNKLFSLKDKHLSLHKSFYAEDPKGNDLFVVKGAFSCKQQSRHLHALID